ncbi:MAG: LysR family transcriptional regulator [Gemmobacter sp.]
MLPNLVDHLTTFVRVADTGSFSAAAREMGRAVSSISYSVAQLEAHCGFPLLDREARRVSLTRRGRALYMEAQAVIKHACRFSAQAATLERGEETRIRIASDVLFPQPLLHEALRLFGRAHPETQLQFFARSLSTLWDDLREGNIDFAIGLADAIPTGFESRSFGQIKLGPYAAAHHPLATRPGPLTPAEFEAERQIYYLSSPRLDLERSGRLFSSDVWTANELEHIRMLIRQGLGWCFATEYFFQDEMETGLIRPLQCVDTQFHPTRMMNAVWPVIHPPGPLAHVLIGHLASVIANGRARQPGAA